MATNSDPLEELPIEKWPELMNKVKKLWPMNVAGYYALYLNLKYRDVKNAFQFQVFCPYGDIDNGFVAISDKGEKDAIIFPASTDTTLLEEALVNTKKISWDRNEICIDLVSSTVLDLLERVKPRIGFSEYYVGALRTVFLDCTTTLFGNVCCPPNTLVSDVRNDDISHVNDVWPYKHPKSLAYFTTLASNGLSYGLYSNDNNKVGRSLLAWVFINEYSFVAHLYCEEEERRKGYGEFLMNKVTNKLLSDGNDVYGYIVKGNDKSLNLFSKLGFEVIDDGSAYLYVRK